MVSSRSSTRLSVDDDDDSDGSLVFVRRRRPPPQKVFFDFSIRETLNPKERSPKEKKKKKN